MSHVEHHHPGARVPKNSVTKPGARYFAAFRMGAEDNQALDQVAEHLGVNRSEALRRGVRLLAAHHGLREAT